MNEVEHGQRHRLLHEHLDELLADYIMQTRRKLSEIQLIDLLKWSAEQVDIPDHSPPRKEDH